MREFVDLLQDRAAEVDKHLAFIRGQHDAAVGLTAGVVRPVDTEHVNILKSGFLVHLYNVVEAVMSKVLDEIAEDIRQHPHSRWKRTIYREWVKTRASFDSSMTQDEKVDRISNLLLELSDVARMPPTRLSVNKGNWNEEEIVRLARRLECDLNITPCLGRRMQATDPGREASH